MTDIPVLIVGAGPTGLMMACELARRGVAFRIIDKAADHTTQSRALAIQARTLEIFTQMGLADTVLSQGQRAQALNAVFSGKPRIRMPLNDFGGSLTAFPYLLILEQSKTEAILSDFLSAHGHTVERNCELLQLSQYPGGVASILRRADGSEETLRSDYVIGAGGAHSVVREQMDIPFEGNTYQTSLYVLDCNVEGTLSPHEIYLYVSDKGIAGFFPYTNGRHRVIGSVPPEFEGKKELTFEDITRGFTSRMRANVTLRDPHWLSVYHSHHRYAAHFRVKRCFLAGDSAHIHSPVGGQGMNTGLQDAYNLAWKLALVIQGKARDGLLNTYELERIEVAKKLVNTTDKAFYFVISQTWWVKALRLYGVPLVLKLLSPLLRGDSVLGKFLFKTISEIGIEYRTSPLSKDDEQGAFPARAPMPGDRAPLSIGSSLTGISFHLLLFTGDKTAVPADIQQLARRFGTMMVTDVIPLTAATENLYKEFGIKESGYYLVRPDMYIATRLNALDAQALALYFTERGFV